MNLVPFTWNGFQINDWFWNNNIGEFSSEFPVGERGKLAATAIYSPVAYNFPKLSTVQYDGHYISVTFHPKSRIAGHTVAFLREQVKMFLQMGKDFSPHALIAQDIEDSNRQWYVSAIPVNFQQTTIGEWVVTFALVDPIWRTVVAGTSGNVSVTASPTNTSLSTIGNFPTPLKITITPNSARPSVFAFKRYVIYYNPLTTMGVDLSHAAVELTGGGLDTATLVTGGKMQASGNDVLVVVDGQVVNRWFGASTHAFNTASTFIWATIPVSANVIVPITVALPLASTPVTVQFASTPAALAFLKTVAGAKNNAFLIDSEVFTFTPSNVDFANYRINQCQRGQKTTTAAAHSVGANAIWLEHDIWLVYGNSTASAPNIDNNYKPIFDLDQSTNAQRVYTNFYSASVPTRPEQMYPAIIYSAINTLTRLLYTFPFTGNHITTVDPSTELGLEMQSAPYLGVQRAEYGNQFWYVWHPFGYQTVSVSGSKYLSILGSWPANVDLVASPYLNGSVLYYFWNEVAPTVAATWQTFSHPSVSLGGTFIVLYLRLVGNIIAKAGLQAAVQYDTVTLVFGASHFTPTMLAEVANYQISSTITNSTTGEEIYVNVNCLVGQTLTIDCGAKTAVLSDGTNVFSGISLSSNRINANWLDLGINSGGGFGGSANMVYTAPGVVNETLNYSWSDLNE